MVSLRISKSTNETYGNFIIFRNQPKKISRKPKVYVGLKKFERL
jgi:hypothetical protein